MTIKAFWNRVKKLIKAHKITQSQFAQYINIPLGSLQGMMHHNREPILSLALDMAKTLGVTIEYLATGSDKEVKNQRLKQLADKQAAIKISTLATEIQEAAKRINSKSV
ncbi:MAG: helix-turn-helix domain-containing protein [Treponema sp.]|jgi:transcriptional regulator with XRE-family HTH domain|nr:helix-turn-helix domain-containing protein [Treponema sp.]